MVFKRLDLFYAVFRWVASGPDNKVLELIRVMSRERSGAGTEYQVWDDLFWIHLQPSETRKEIKQKLNYPTILSEVMKTFSFYIVDADVICNQKE